MTKQKKKKTKHVVKRFIINNLKREINEIVKKNCNFEKTS